MAENFRKILALFPACSPPSVAPYSRHCGRDLMKETVGRDATGAPEGNCGQVEFGFGAVAQFLARDLIPEVPGHPWLTAPGDVLPGKREHVASVLVAQAFLDRYEHAAQAPVRFPLLAQPVMEACLRVPTWMSITEGRNRALARDAFGDVLPKTISARQTKSGLNVFMGAAFEANRVALSAQLVRGWLVTAGLADGQAIRQVLEDPAPDGLDMARVLYLADVEAWARTWGQA